MHITYYLHITFYILYYIICKIKFNILGLYEVTLLAVAMPYLFASIKSNDK